MSCSVLPIFLGAALSLLSPGFCAYTPDLVTDLPGYDGTVPYTQYSGYLNGSEDGNIQLHYWFVTSQSDPDTDPLVLWLNGGPGCSSLDGMLYEHGPLLIKGDGTNLTVNPWAWNKLANMIYLESPACVGFSISKNGDCSTGDDRTAEQNYLALLSFLDKFPEYQGRDLYITGESYGGVYVPTLTLKIFKSDSILQSMLKGFAVGNGLLSNLNNTNSLVQFGYTHGIISSEAYDSMLQNCGCQESELLCDFKTGASNSMSCATTFAWSMISIYNENLNIYDVVDVCYHADEHNTTPTPGDLIKARLTKENLMFGMEHLQTKLNRKTRKLLDEGVSVPCVDSVGATKYLNQESVREALHIDASAPAWSICADIPYNKKYEDMVDQVTELVNGGIQGLIYNGDVDGACNFIGDEYFVMNLGFPSTTLSLPWYLPNRQIGGWWKSYGDKLQFTTVRGAGHTVPQYKPMAAYVMWEAFLNNHYA